MRYLLVIFLSSFFAAPLSAQEKSKIKKDHVIDLFAGEKAVKGTTGVVIEGGNSEEGDEFGGLSGKPGFTLKFQRGGNGIFVPAKVNGKKVYFLFDTGATTTTLTPGIAKAARVQPERDAPSAMLSTANGTIESQYGIIDNLKLGGRSHFNVSYAMCKGCPSGKFRGKPIAGLLGMNVIGRYKSMIDDEKGVVELSPLKSSDNRVRDVRLFLEIQPIGGSQGKKDVKIKVMIRNHGKIAMKNLKIKLSCQDQKSTKKKITKLAGRSKKMLSFRVSSPNCGLPQAQLQDAEWGR